jgi:hypothetical protein
MQNIFELRTSTATLNRHSAWMKCNLFDRDFARYGYFDREISDL